MVFLPIIVGLLLLAAPARAEAAGGQGKVTPETPAPGAPISLSFWAPASSLPLEARVMESTTCDILDASKTAVSQCVASPVALVDAKVAPGTESYAFSVNAPSVPGNYTALFTRSSTIALPGDDVTIDVPFRVAIDGTQAVTPGSVPGGTQGAPNGGGPGGTGGPGPQEGAGTGSGLPGRATPDAARWLAGSSLGSATILVTLVASRWGLGGKP